MLFHEQPTKPWNEYDFKLIEAYQILQDEICPKCGQPIWLCRSTDTNMAWKVRNDTCEASREVDEATWRRQNKGKNPTSEERRSWGLIEYPVAYVLPTATEGTTLPTRKAFYDAMREQRND